MSSDRNQNSIIPFDANHWVGAWVRMWNSYDLSQVDELFLPNDHLTYFSSEKQGALTGIDQVREHHRGFGFVEGGKDQANKLWLEETQVSVLGPTAVVTAIWFFEKPDGTQMRGPMTIVYAEHCSEYRIAHMNFSNYPSA